MVAAFICGMVYAPRDRYFGSAVASSIRLARNNTAACSRNHCWFSSLIFATCRVALLQCCRRVVTQRYSNAGLKAATCRPAASQHDDAGVCKRIAHHVFILRDSCVSAGSRTRFVANAPYAIAMAVETRTTRAALLRAPFS